MVADSVNPLAVTRAGWREAAILAKSPYAEIEVVCSNSHEHRTRIESRKTNVIGLKLPSWEDVVNREYEPWNQNRIVIDTAGQSQAQSFSDMFEALGLRLD